MTVFLLVLYLAQLPVREKLLWQLSGKVKVFFDSREIRHTSTSDRVVFSTGQSQRFNLIGSLTAERAN